MENFSVKKKIKTLSIRLAYSKRRLKDLLDSKNKVQI